MTVAGSIALPCASTSTTSPGDFIHRSRLRARHGIGSRHHRTYEYLYLSQTLDAREAHRLGMVNRVVPRDDLDQAVELIANQIAQAPLSVLMGIKAGVKRAWEGMGMRVHLQSHLQVMEAVGRAGDVFAWRQENQEKGYGASPRQIAARRAEAAAERARSARNADGTDLSVRHPESL